MFTCFSLNDLYDLDLMPNNSIRPNAHPLKVTDWVVPGINPAVILVHVSPYMGAANTFDQNSDKLVADIYAPTLPVLLFVHPRAFIAINSKYPSGSDILLVFICIYCSIGYFNKFNLDVKSKRVYCISTSDLIPPVTICILSKR